MADISKITLPTGTTYNIKDAQARSDIATIIDSLAGGISFIGETTTELTDGATTNPITINGESRTVIAGNMVFHGNKEFLFDGTKWTEMGNLDALGEFAYVDAGNAQITPHGTVSQPTFTGSSSAVTVTATDNANGNYQPKGTVSQPTFTGSTSTFTGTAQPTGAVTVTLTHAPTDYAIKVHNSQNDTYADYTPSGTVSQPTFTGEQSTVAVTATTNTSGNYQPAGTVSKPSFTGSSSTFTGKFTPAGNVSFTNTNQTTTVSKATSGTATYTPEGTVAAPTISVATAGATTTVNSITAVGTLPALTTTVSNENLTIGWSAGTLPTKGANQTVKTGDAAYTASAPAFTGTGARLVTGNISVPSSASFTGTEGNISASGTPNGSVSQPTFTGTKVQLAGTTTASGTVSQPTFAGTAVTNLVAKDVDKVTNVNNSLSLDGIDISVSGKPSGTVSQPTFTGTKAQISGTVTPSGTVSQPTFTGTQESWWVHPGAPE